MSVILASNSAVRSTLLANAGIPHETRGSGVDEDAVKSDLSGVSCADVAIRLAECKAGKVSEAFPDALVIGADQVLVCENRMFDKAKTVDEAKERLLFLKNRTHRLISGAALAQNGRLLDVFHDEARLHMRDFSSAFLKAYLEKAGKSVLTSVGCYELEGPGILLFDRIEGNYFTILGLPMLELLEKLRRHGELTI